MKKIYWLLLFVLIPAVLLAGCSNSPALTATQAPQATSTLPQAAVTSTPAPSPTSPATKVLFVAPAQAGPQANSLQAALNDLSGKSGLTLASLPALQKSDLAPDVKVVVLLAPPADLPDLLAAAPQVQFVVVSAVDLPAAANLTVIRTKAENQAFVAGFISVLLSTDFRAAGLLPSDGPLGAGLKEVFVNGGHYFCGVCAPGWPLKVYYPVVAEQPAAADGPTWQAAAASLFDNQKVEVYYLTQAAARPEVIAYLQGRAQADKTLAVLGDAAPPDALKAQWAGTVHFNLSDALQQVWPEVVAGKGGATQPAKLSVDDVNPDILGPGKMRLVKNLMDLLDAGQVLPNTVPAQ